MEQVEEMNQKIVSGEKSEYWNEIFNSWLPILALVAPITLFCSALIRASGVGVLPDDLDWISKYEAIVGLAGAPFGVATFIFVGRIVADEFPKTGVMVTIFGVLFTGFMVFITSFRGLAAGYVELSVDPALINEGQLPIWVIPILIYNLLGFIAHIGAGIALIRGKSTLSWCGWSMILGIICIPIAQAFYFHLEIFYPLGTGLILLSIIGLVRQR